MYRAKRPRRARRAGVPRALLVTLVLLGGTAPSVVADDVVRAELDWRRGATTQYPQRRLRVATEPHAGVTPPDGEERLRYGRVSFGPTRHLVFAGRFDAAAPRLWLDRDFDGDLRDESSIPLQVRRNYISGTVDVELPRKPPGPSTSIRVYVGRYTYEELEVRLGVWAHREGSVVVAGRLRRMVLLDLSGDLKFDDVEKDALLLDLDGDGALPLDGYGARSPERVIPGRPFRVGNAGWVAHTPSADGASVAFSRADTVPPPPPGTWTPQKPNRAGWRWNKSPRPLEALIETYEAWREKAIPGRSTRAHRTSLQRIGSVGTPEAFDYLHRVYRKDDNAEIRAMAVEAMGSVAFVAEASRVAKIGGTARDARARSAALRTLHGMDAPDRLRVYLERWERERNDDVLEDLALYLTYTRTPEARAILLREVLRPSSAARQYHAYLAVTRYEADPPPASLILAAARTTSRRLRAATLRDAWRLRLPLARSLALDAVSQAGDDALLRTWLVEVLGSTGDRECIEALMALAEKLDRRQEQRLLELVGAVRAPSAIRALESGLGSTHRRVRMMTAQALARIGSAEIAPVVGDRLTRETDVEVLLALVATAGRTGDPDLVRRLVATARRFSSQEKVGRAVLEALAAIGFEHDSVRAYFEMRMASKDAHTRQAVVSVAAGSRDPYARDILLGAVSDLDGGVRSVAVAAFRTLRLREAIPVLIAQLPHEKDERVRESIAETLYALTGQNLYDVHEVWLRWWSEHRDDFEVPEVVPPRPTIRPDASTTPTFYGIPVRAKRVAFVLDKSGSMAESGGRRQGRGPETKYQRAVAETLGVVRRLPGFAKVNVVCFDSGVRLWKGSLVKVSARVVKELSTFLDGLGPTGGTNFYGGMQKALRLSGVEAIYVLSDGQPSSGEYVEAEDILRGLRVLNRRRRVTIHCIALGHHSPLLEALASENQGTYVQR